MQDVFQVYKDLSKPQSEANSRSFTASLIEHTPHRVATDTEGHAVLLLSTPSGHEREPAIHLEHLSVEYNVRCKIIAGKEVEESVFTVISCRKSDEDLVRYFFRVAIPVLLELGPEPTEIRIREAISHLVELFRAITAAPTKSLNGLWAELFVISASTDPEMLLRAWHTDPEEKFDFSSGMQRIEVKSSSRRDRQHHFALEQLSPPTGCRAVIVSLFTARSAGGSSILDQISRIKNIVRDVSLHAKIDSVVTRSLGNAVRYIDSACFDVELAKDSMRVYSTDSAPRIQPPLPAHVYDVHFKADLASVVPLSSENLKSEGGIIGSIVLT